MKKKTKVILGVSALALAGAAYAGYQFLTPDPTPVDSSATAQSNYYQFINNAWLSETEIPADKPAVGVMNEMTDSIDEKLKADLKNMAEGKEKTDILGMDKLLAYYELAGDFDRLNKEGTEPVKAKLAQIEELGSIAEIADHYQTWHDEAMPALFSVSVSVNPEKTTEKQLDLSGAGIIFPDTSYYEDENTYNQLVSLWTSSTVHVLERMGYDEKEAQEMVKNALAFDKQIVPYTMSSEEASDVKNSIHQMSLDQVAAYSKIFQLDQIMTDFLGKRVEKVNVSTPEFFENMDKLYVDENLELIKDWLIIREARYAAQYLDEETRHAANEFSNAMSGVTENPSKEDFAYNLATSSFSEPLSVYYGEKYFGEEAKKDVEGMIDNIIMTYTDRLKANDWLTEETKAKAIEKLEAMTYYVGYPTEVNESYELIEIDSSKSLYENTEAIGKWAVQYSFDQFDEPIDKTTWQIPSFMVNAYYSPLSNAIVFPAAILQEPFYSKDQALAANYGGIGAVIAHEITHAFDNNGSLFDKEGNMQDWWTEADYKAFEEKTKLMVAQWDGLEIYGGQVNGELTVGENIADAGGVSASLATLQKLEPKADLKVFFENYARIWRQKASLQFNQLLLRLDTHSPSELRVNRQLMNLDAFYETYDIQEGDAMYLPEDERIQIW